MIVQGLCPKCESSFITWAGGDSENCEKCGEPLTLIEPDKIEDPQILLEIAEMELEDANYHKISSLPGSIYGAVAGFVPEDKHTALARAIYNAFSI